MEFRYSKQKYDLSQLSSLEWLETNNLGSYASSTILDCHTRKYHGLLVSKLHNLPDKYVLLSKFDEALVITDKEYPLTVHQYADCSLNDAFSYFQEFICDTHPQTIYQIADSIYLTKEILLISDSNTALIKYKLVGIKNAKLRLKPLFAYRNFHALTKENFHLNATLIPCSANQSSAKNNDDGSNCNIENSDNTNNLSSPIFHTYKLTPYQGMPGIFITAALRSIHSNESGIKNAATSTATPTPTNNITNNIIFTQNVEWYRNFAYSLEQQRGYDYIEDLFAPCSIEFTFDGNTEVIIACSLQELAGEYAQSMVEIKHKFNQQNKQQEAISTFPITHSATSQSQYLFELWAHELKKRRNHIHKSHGSALQKQLKKTANSFLNKQYSIKHTVTAGYHWFLEWGRDAMIALPGLTLHSELEQECLAVLQEFASHEKAGLIPNFIGITPDANAYNSVDASLWFAYAVQQYCDKTNNIQILVATQIWDTLKNIFTNYKNGTLHNIKMQDDGLLYAGSKEINLTWMDAVVCNKPVTPRYGLAVEINALWFNALSFIHSLAITLSDPIKDTVAQLLPKIRLNFCQTFYAAELGYLHDFINEEEKNISIRPNQIFAVSLPYSPLPKKIALQIVDKVREHLLTPYGLRTLAPSDTFYHGIYSGNQETRDLAYHNGTVWPWLLGHFGDAALKVYDKKYVIQILQPCMTALREHLHTGGIGTIAEVFSGDAPHQANGCISQAWSVAEVLRLTYLLSQFDRKILDL